MNCLRITAEISLMAAFRYSPAGVPVLDLELLHSGSQTEDAQARTVKVLLKALALGAMAERLSKQPLQRPIEFTGFLSSPHAKTLRPRVVFHIQEFQLID